MRTRRNIVLGVAATALALTGCGTAVSHSGGTAGGQVAQAPARNAATGTSAIAMADLAGVKRHMTWVDGYFAPRPRPGTPGFTDLRDLAEVKRDTGRNTAQARGR